MGRVRLLLVVLTVSACHDDTNPVIPDMAMMELGPGVDFHVPRPATKCAAAGQSRVLSNLPGTHALPRVGFTGANFVVAWNTAQAGQYRIDVSLTDLQGNRLGPNIPLSQNPIADSWAPSVSTLINGTVIAWTRLSAGKSDIVIDTLDTTGQRLDASGKPCDPAQPSCGIFAVTSSGSASYPYLSRPEADIHSATPVDNQVGLAFVDTRNYAATPYNDVYWKRITANGTALTPEQRLTASVMNRRNEFPRLAFDGVHDSLVWRDATQAANVLFYFAALDSNGLVSKGPIQVGQTSGSFVSAGAPDLVWTGNEYALATANGSDAASSVVFQRFQSNGISTLNPVGVTFGGVACTPAIAWDGEFFAVVWQTDCGQPGSNLAFELIDPSGTRYASDGTSCGTSVDPTCGVIELTSYTVETASFPEIVWAGGTSFGVAWMDTARGGADGGVDSQVYFTRVDCTEP
jgi:hypothetical protein